LDWQRSDGQRGERDRRNATEGTGGRFERYRALEPPAFLAVPVGYGTANVAVSMWHARVAEWLAVSVGQSVRFQTNGMQPNAIFMQESPANTKR